MFSTIVVIYMCGRSILFNFYRRKFISSFPLLKKEVLRFQNWIKKKNILISTWESRKECEEAIRGSSHIALKQYQDTGKSPDSDFIV